MPERDGGMGHIPAMLMGELSLPRPFRCVCRWPVSHKCSTDAVDDAECEHKMNMKLLCDRTLKSNVLMNAAARKMPFL